jgi:hypothetical protein
MLTAVSFGAVKRRNPKKEGWIIPSAKLLKCVVSHLISALELLDFWCKMS